MTRTITRPSVHAFSCGRRCCPYVHWHSCPKTNCVVYCNILDYWAESLPPATLSCLCGLHDVTWWMIRILDNDCLKIRCVDQPNEGCRARTIKKGVRCFYALLKINILTISSVTETKESFMKSENPSLYNFRALFLTVLSYISTLQTLSALTGLHLPQHTCHH